MKTNEDIYFLIKLGTERLSMWYPNVSLSLAEEPFKVHLFEQVHYQFILLFLLNIGVSMTEEPCEINLFE